MNALNPILPRAASAADDPSSSGTGLPSSQGLNNMFLQLLVAQLQNQSPLNPMDPTQFVGQLAQFSELSEVTQIEQILQKAVTSGSVPAATGSAQISDSQPNGSGEPLPAAMLSSAVAAAQAAIPAPFAPSSVLNSKIQGVF
ncbi:MAG TPA: flagellar hook capping FlgD N-terminal domain-containing protein [Candidatus Binatia bacterium]|nr:flagellar hook capping FlgD N-terminal domain-containing protein [Candidatus Binatia bacterium]